MMITRLQAFSMRALACAFLLPAGCAATGPDDSLSNGTTIAKPAAFIPAVVNGRLDSDATYRTTLFIHNLGAVTTADCAIQYRATGSAQPLTEPLAPIAPGATLGLETSSHPGVSAAVVRCDQPVAVTTAYNTSASPSGGAPSSFPMVRGADPEHAGSTLYVPTFLTHMFDASSAVVVQNLSEQAQNVTVRFVPTTLTVPATYVGADRSRTYIIEPRSNIVVDTAEVNQVYAGLTSFNGSLVIEAPATVGLAAIVFEQSEGGAEPTSLRTYEATSRARTTLAIPTVLCRFNADESTTSYAIQNVGTATTTLEASFTYNTPFGPYVRVFSFPSIAPGEKASIHGCGPQGDIATGSIGSAVVTSNPPQLMAGMYKVFSANHTPGVQIAAETNLDPAPVQVLPYVTAEASPSGMPEDTFIAIQNATGQRTTIQIDFLTKDGKLAKAPDGKPATLTRTLDGYVKTSVSGRDLGLFAFTGSARIVTAQPEHQITAIARARRCHDGKCTLDDYAAVASHEWATYGKAFCGSLPETRYPHALMFEGFDASGSSALVMGATYASDVVLDLSQQQLAVISTRGTTYTSAFGVAGGVHVGAAFTKQDGNVLDVWQGAFISGSLSYTPIGEFFGINGGGFATPDGMTVGVQLGGGFSFGPLFISGQIAQTESTAWDQATEALAVYLQTVRGCGVEVVSGGTPSHRYIQFQRGAGELRLFSALRMANCLFSDMAVENRIGMTVAAMLYAVASDKADQDHQSTFGAVERLCK